ncbi:unnamed protein product [Protopolystoma xenopodis]|uniref:guanylate cyclase n=1 Tax=Protopolystoma xenopodis TaxID=117903 RepID=A0A448XF81_9PLAT|nr:unnamed protein product [Protopolystoma xenopodis]
MRKSPRHKDSSGPWRNTPWTNVHKSTLTVPRLPVRPTYELLPLASLKEMKDTFSIVAINEKKAVSHCIYRIQFENARSNVTKDDVLRIPTHVFFDIFPFHLIFDHSMHVLHAGKSLLYVFPRILNMELTHAFELNRPMIDFTWDHVRDESTLGWTLQKPYANLISTTNSRDASICNSYHTFCIFM